MLFPSRVVRSKVLDVFNQVQMGFSPNVGACRTFVQHYFSNELASRSVSLARLRSMDAVAMHLLLKQLFADKYFSVPFTPLTFDLEFTNLPTFSDAGPNESIIEIAAYSPEIDRCFSSLVQPLNSAHKISDSASKLTGLKQVDLKNAPSFGEAWEGLLNFIDEASQGNDEAKKRVLLISHGAKASDEAMLQWHVRQATGEDFPHWIQIGDSDAIARELHRRRPASRDKHPPSWSLTELAAWLKLPQVDASKAHRAEADARLTWDVLAANLDRYGAEDVPPKLQLIQRFYDDSAKLLIADIDKQYQQQQQRNLDSAES